MKIGIIREGKTPPDKRVPLSPSQCKYINENFENVEVYVQHSEIRAFTDEEYKNLGVEVVDNISHCDVLMGVKEVKIADLIADKKYFFFSHTIKKQPYNRDLLQNIIDKNIQLIDYEVLKNQRGIRLIGFGRYAGIVGAYNALLAYGKKHNLYDLKPANQCFDKKEMLGELKKVKLPSNTKIVLTGLGRVGKGAIEILEELKLKKVGAKDFLTQNYNEAIYTQLSVEDYNQKLNKEPFVKEDFYKDPSGYESTFMQYAEVADMYIACHYWDESSPFIFTREDAKSEDFNISIVADISCDIDGPVASTIRPSTIANPLYGYNPETEKEIDFYNNTAIGVMAVDNLPCELPRDASEDFGKEFIDKILPNLLDDEKQIIDNATITRNKKLTHNFTYLQDYLEGKE